MTNNTTRPILIILLVAGALGAAAVTSRSGVSAAPDSAEGRTPVIVELFTSEGCSSCPPADVLLSRLEKTQPVAGADVIALGEHVDYWNHGGWADHFSSQLFSDRQSEYSDAFRLDGVYTPQMIVDGRTQFVGSDADQARAAIAGAARQPKARVSVARVGDTFSVRVDHLPSSARRDPVDVMLAVTEGGLSSSVGGGENAGRRLEHSAVVRKLLTLGTVSNDAFTASPSVKAAPDWQRGNLSVVVFVQERGSRRIIGAARVAWECRPVRY